MEDTEFGSREIPHMRAVLGRFDERDAVLALQAHHVAIDGWSMQLIMRDLVTAYSARAGRGAAPADVAQYREYSAWQKADLGEESLAAAREYWRAKLHGARMLGVPVGRRRPEDATPVFAVHRFVFDAELTSALLTAARNGRSSPFMVLLAAYNLLLRDTTGDADIVIPTITFGRGHPRFDDTVGPFFNFVPLRTDLTGCETVRDVLARTRATCIEAQTHEIPFAHILAEAPELMETFGDDGVAVCAFQAFQNGPNGGRMGSVEYTELRRRVLFQSTGSDIPDGALWTMEIDPSGEIFGCVRYDRNEFDQSGPAGLVERFERLLRRVVTTPDSAV
ncbi:condensation domain-containing protein [Actinomadura sp. CNU-125]|uniref:condensation domain-containing protein n=1 Tax=Actinomadura sp. CNU-125 TaxID=1904961 RepID=UPI0021CCB60B|nr:condensation domain-containing protein [Actinomadura sp. CNU-125]